MITLAAWVPEGIGTAGAAAGAGAGVGALASALVDAGAGAGAGAVASAGAADVVCASSPCAAKEARRKAIAPGRPGAIMVESGVALVDGAGVAGAVPGVLESIG